MYIHEKTIYMQMMLTKEANEHISTNDSIFNERIIAIMIWYILKIKYLEIKYLKTEEQKKRERKFLET